MKEFLRNTGIVLLGALFLCSPALYNAFPLVYPDTGAYLVSGFEGLVLPDRPIMYGLFLRHISMKFSLWFPIFLQCILVALMLYIMLREFLRSQERFFLVYMSIILVLTAATGLAWYTGQLMPDIFAPLLALSFVYFLFAKKLEVFKVIFISFLFILCVSVHYSHFLLSVLISVVLTCLGLFYKLRKRDFIPFKRIAIVAGLSGLSWLYILSINYWYDNDFRLSKGSHAFLMSHYIETGVMAQYLKENCDKPELKNCKMCIYKDSLEMCSGNFLWCYPSTLYKTGGWIDTREEYNYIFRQMNSNPRYFLKNMYCSFRFGLSQLFLNKVGNGLGAITGELPPGPHIKKYFLWEHNTFMLSMQYLDRLPPLFDTINNCQNLLLILSILLFIYYFGYTAHNDPESAVIKFILFFVILNSFATAGINIPHERLQCRVVWLVIFFSMILLANKKESIRAAVRRLFGSGQ
jgi:hypothetical protein